MGKRPCGSQLVWCLHRSERVKWRRITLPSSCAHRSLRRFMFFYITEWVYTCHFGIIRLTNKSKLVGQSKNDPEGGRAWREVLTPNQWLSVFNTSINRSLTLQSTDYEIKVPLIKLWSLGTKKTLKIRPKREREGWQKTVKPWHNPKRTDPKPLIHPLYKGQWTKTPDK